jgi:hypothetical protein
LYFLERKNKFVYEYHCGSVRYEIDPNDKVHALGRTRLIPLKPPVPAEDQFSQSSST